MKFATRLIGKSLASKPVRKTAKSATLPAFESLEARQHMSASSIAAVSYMQPINAVLHVGGLTTYVHLNNPTTAVFSINADGSVSESTGPGTSKNLGGYASQISAGLDSNGQPEVFAIGGDNAAYVNHGSGWSSLGGYVKQISGSNNNTLYAIGGDNSAYVNHGSGWSGLGGSLKQISASTDGTLFGIGTDNAAWVDHGTGWSSLGGYVKQISAASNGIVYGVGSDNSVFVNAGKGWSSLGGQATQISAGLDTAGKPEVFATGLPYTEVFVNDGNGWVDLHGAGVEIAAPAIGVGVPNSSVAVVGMNGQTFGHNASGFYSLPSTLDAVQFKFQSMGGPSGPLGLQLNAEQGVSGTNGRVQDFQGGSIYWSPSTGAHVVTGVSLASYRAHGGPAGFLGFPTGDTTNYPNGQITYFQHGKILNLNGSVSAIAYSSSMTFTNVSQPGRTDGYLYTSQAVGGRASLTVRSDGSYSFSYNFNNSSFWGLTSYNYTVSIALVSPTGQAYTFTHSAVIGGGGDAGTINGVDPRIAANWQDLAGAKVIAKADASINWGGFIGEIKSAIDDVVTVAGYVEQAIAIVGPLLA